MNEIAPLNCEETLREVQAANLVPRAGSWLQPAIDAIPSTSRLVELGYSLIDQACAVGGMFLVNIALARAQSKEEYGVFVLSYSVFAFLVGLYYAAILEPYTVYGAGRYRAHFSEYLRLMVRTNAVLAALLTGILLTGCLLIRWVMPQLLSRALVGLALTAGILLSGFFLRRAFYLQRQPGYAAKSSLVFFVTVVCGLWVTARLHRLDSLSAFLILALGWIVAGGVFGKKLNFGKPKRRFLELEPEYWREHVKYSKWVLATAFVFQFTIQGYYWLVGVLLSAKEVANLRAMYMLVGPVEQVFIAVSYLIVPVLAGHYAAKRMGNYVSAWKRYALATVGVTGLYAVSIRLLGKPVVHVLYAGKYDGLTSFLYLLALLPFVMWIGTTMGQALNAAEKPHFHFWAYICSGVGTLLLGIPLVMYFGLRGAVYGMLLSGTVYTVALAISFFLLVRHEAWLRRGHAL